MPGQQQAGAGRLRSQARSGRHKAAGVGGVGWDGRLGQEVAELCEAMGEADVDGPLQVSALPTHWGLGARVAMFPTPQGAASCAWWTWYP